MTQSREVLAKVVDCVMRAKPLLRGSRGSLFVRDPFCRRSPYLKAIVLSSIESKEFESFMSFFYRLSEVDVPAPKGRSSSRPSFFTSSFVLLPFLLPSE